MQNKIVYLVKYAFKTLNLLLCIVSTFIHIVFSRFQVDIPISANDAVRRSKNILLITGMVPREGFHIQNKKSSQNFCNPNIIKP